MSTELSVTELSDEELKWRGATRGPTSRPEHDDFDDTSWTRNRDP
jgi:hypothetical protein